MRSTAHTTTFLISATFSAGTPASDFEFDFTPSYYSVVHPIDTPTLPGACGGIDGGFFNSLCGIGNGIEIQDPDTTPFYQGQVAGNDGYLYWHIIVGDPSTGFAQESFTRMDATGLGSFSGGQTTDMSGFDPFNLGVNTGVFSGIPTFQSLEVISGNGWAPLRSNDVDFTGNASGNPTRTTIRQVMGNGTWNAQTRTWSCDSATFCSEFSKSTMNAKPIISQTVREVTAGLEMEALFKIDMSNSSYSDATTRGVITNIQTIQNVPGGDFDMATDTQDGRSVVTGGRYAYNDCANPDYWGTCWQIYDVSGGPSDYEEGSYTYTDGGSVDPMSYDWAAFFDPLQNPASESDPESGNKAKCNSADNPQPNSC